MANKFRPIKETSAVEQERIAVNRPRIQSDNQVDSRIDDASSIRNKMPREKKTRSKTGKKVRKAFVNIFGLGILRKINLKKNLPYFIMIVIMIIALIYNSLNTQSKRLKVEQLEEEIVKINDLIMDVVEEEYNIDDKREKELLQIAQDEGFQGGGYIPYTIKSTEKK